MVELSAKWKVGLKVDKLVRLKVESTDALLAAWTDVCSVVMLALTRVAMKADMLVA